MTEPAPAPWWHRLGGWLGDRRVAAIDLRIAELQEEIAHLQRERREARRG